MEHGARNSGSAESACSTWWFSPDQPVTPVAKFQPCLESLLDSEASLWCSPELRIVGQTSSQPILNSAWQANSQDGNTLLRHGRLVGAVHDYYLNLEKNRCCLTLAGRRNIINSVRVVQDNDAPPHPLSPPPPAAARQQPVAGGRARQAPSRRGNEVLLAGDSLTLYQSALLSAFLPVLAAPGPPSPFTPALATTPTDVTVAGFSFGGAATAGDKEVPALRMSAAASALANLEKDFGSTGELSSFVSTKEHQYYRQGVKKGAEPPALDSVTTEMLRELARLTFQQSDQQQMCTEHDLRDAVGRRSYSEVLARHLMARLSVLENNSHQFYRPTAFLCPQAYDEWVQGEKQHIKQLLNRFWHYSLPHPSRTSASSSSSSLSARLLRADHHAAYVQLLERLVHQQESVKRHPGVPLLPTARRLLKEFALRFGVGELFCRVAYLRLLSQSMEHDVWFCRHVCVSLLAVLELLPVKPSQRTAAVKCELERLHEAVATLHSHVDHALTRIHILFPNNAPPDGIASMLQLLSLVLFAQRYLTNQPGQSVAHWLQRYLEDGFAWRYEYHKTVLSTELQIVSASNPLTPALMNGLLVEIRGEVLSLADCYESSFKRYFSISQLGRRAFYQLLMRDIQDLCRSKVPEEQLELDMLALMYRLAELDATWSASVMVQEQVWREPFFRLVLSWLQVLHKHAVRWLLTACINDTWSVLRLPGLSASATHFRQLVAAPPLATAGGALTSTPLLAGALRPEERFPATASPSSSLFGGQHGMSAFSQHRSVSNIALAGSMSFAQSDSATAINASLAPRSRSNTFSSLTSASADDGGNRRHSSLLQQSLVSNEMPSFERMPSVPQPGKRSQTPVLAFMCQRSSDSLSPVFSDRSTSSSQREGRSSSAAQPVAVSATKHADQQQRATLFRGDDLVPARPAVLQAPSLSLRPASATRRTALLKPVVAGSATPRSVTQYLPSPVSSHGIRRQFQGLADDSTAAAAVANSASAFGSPVKPPAISFVPAHGANVSIGQARTEEWVASVSQSEDNSDGQPRRPASSTTAAHAEPGAEQRAVSASRPIDFADSHFRGAAAAERKISVQSSDSVRTDSALSSAYPRFSSLGSASLGEEPVAGQGVERTLPVSSSLVDLVVILSRLTNAIALLTDVICPSSAACSGVSSSGRASTASSVDAGCLRSVSVTSASSDVDISGVQWSKGMDVGAVASAMYSHVFTSGLDMLSECATLYADNMLCTDLCGIPEGDAAHLIGAQLLEHIKSRHRAGLLWGCRHYQASERCSSSTTGSGGGGRDRHAMRCSAHCAANGDVMAIEPLAAEMCTRVNNVSSLLATYPLLQSAMLAQVCQRWQVPGRDSGVPFSPSQGLGPTVAKATEQRCDEVCTHVGRVLDGLIYIIAHRLNLFAAPCLHELLSLQLPASYSLDEHLRPLDLYLSRHLAKLKQALYEECFLSLLLVLWKMTVQNIQRFLADWRLEGKKRKLEEEACFLLRVVAHYMQFFHCSKKGLDLALLSSVSRPLLHVLDVYVMSTVSLTSLHGRLFSQERRAASAQGGALAVPPALITALRNDLHAKKKSFSGLELTAWLLNRCGQFGISASQQSRHRVAQNLLSLGMIRFVDDGRAAQGVSRNPVFLDGKESLYRFTDSRDCSADTPVGQLLSSLEIDRLEASCLDDSTSLSGSAELSTRAAAMDSVLAALRNRSTYDRTAKAYLTQVSVAGSR